MYVCVSPFACAVIPRTVCRPPRVSLRARRARLVLPVGQLPSSWLPPSYSAMNRSWLDPNKT
eukprot:2082183-Heterocapsa_arctica.AAC.1